MNLMRLLPYSLRQRLTKRQLAKRIATRLRPAAAVVTKTESLLHLAEVVMVGGQRIAMPRALCGVPVKRIASDRDSGRPSCKQCVTIRRQQEFRAAFAKKVPKPTKPEGLDAK